MECQFASLVLHHSRTATNALLATYGWVGNDGLVDLNANMTPLLIRNIVVYSLILKEQYMAKNSNQSAYLSLENADQEALTKSVISHYESDGDRYFIASDPDEDYKNIVWLVFCYLDSLERHMIFQHNGVWKVHSHA